MVYLHPKRLSPDPTVGRRTKSLPENRCGLALYPHRLVEAAPSGAAVKKWGAELDLYRKPGPLVATPDGDGRVELLLDFGTELDAALEIVVRAPGRCNMMSVFGESEPEARSMVPGTEPLPTAMWPIPRAGRNRHLFEVRAFRFVRLLFHDLRGKGLKPLVQARQGKVPVGAVRERPGRTIAGGSRTAPTAPALVIERIVAHAEFTFRKRDGDFLCSDERFQRVWQSSAYTARLCTRPDTLWDGIKRDRIGWFGDARITKEATDLVYFDPQPTEAMLMTLPTNKWANSIPNYSFDAIAMLRQHILTYGLGRRKCIAETYRRVRAMLAWAKRTQTNRAGLIIRDDTLKYFAEIGYVDWSVMPVGGRLEELSWLQCKYLEALRDAAWIAATLGKTSDAAAWTAQATRLHKTIVRKFWKPGVGFLHTLNHVGKVRNPQLPGGGTEQYHQSYDPQLPGASAEHYRRTYLEKIRKGPSGPTRQANALAVWAGVCTEAMRETILKRVFNNRRIEPVTTAYFTYYEQMARARLGDGAGAVLNMRDYVGAMLEREDAATIWELWDPRVDDLRKYYGHFELGWVWPMSLCHGWGAGAVPLAARHLLGVEPVAPGYRRITIRPALDIPWRLDATIPTPHGPIRVARPRKAGP